MSNPLYQQNSVSGEITTWKRTNQIVISNPANGIPAAIFVEEIATQLPDGSVMVNPSTQIQESITDMTTSFNLIDPTTGNAVGTMTYGQLYAAMYSLYLSLAAVRDAVNTPS
jgi:hypothetical protein